jgi:hypothetical protein
MKHKNFLIYAFQEPAALNKLIKKQENAAGFQNKDKRALKSMVNGNLCLLLDKSPQKSRETGS